MGRGTVKERGFERGPRAKDPTEADDSEGEDESQRMKKEDDSELVVSPKRRRKRVISAPPYIDEDVS